MTQASKDLLRAQYVGKTLGQVITPAVVLDLANVEANCNLMLEAARRLQLNWRAHIKTHKTAELTRLQVGDDASTPVNIIVSTIMEAEGVLPLLQEYQARGRQVNVLYSFPLYSTGIDRLAAISSQLGPDGLSVMVDHPDQLKHLTSLASRSGNRPLVFLKVNVGSNRAGAVPDSPECASLIEQLLLSEAVGSSVFLGVYSHAGHSYAARRDWEAMGILGTEFATLKEVADAVRRQRPDQQLVLSVGATPTTTSLQHPDFGDASSSSSVADDEGASVAAAGKETQLLGSGTETITAQTKSQISSLKSSGFTLEVHAGVYPTLDLQQLAAHARDSTHLNWRAVAISVLAEVASVYPGRGPGGTTEALVNAGCLALGREPCADMGEVKGVHYSAWGMLTPWVEGGSERFIPASSPSPPTQTDEEAEEEEQDSKHRTSRKTKTRGHPVPGPDFPAVHGGWQVASMAQEHGILRWMGPREEEVPLQVGQKVRIWPNHACITGAGHGWYLVVDSRNLDREDEIVDVWPRWNGW